MEPMILTMVRDVIVVAIGGFILLYMTKNLSKLDKMEERMEHLATKEDLRKLEKSTKEDLGKLEKSTKEDFSKLEKRMEHLATKEDLRKLEKSTKEDLQKQTERIIRVEASFEHFQIRAGENPLQKQAPAIAEGKPPKYKGEDKK